MLETVNKMQPGWNLGNTLDAPRGETSWGNPLTTRGIIEDIADTGFNSIRIPVTWRHRSGDGPDYEIFPESMERVREIVKWALDAGVTAIINLHHDSEWVREMETDREAVMARYTAYWKQIAAAFADYPHDLMFESINEPRWSDNWQADKPVYFEMLDELNTVFVDIVRASGGGNGTRPLLLTTVTGSTEQTRMDELYKTMERLNDPNLIATVHYYGHYHFSVNLGGATAFSPMVSADIDRMLERCVDTFVSRGIPVIIGEYGLLGFDISTDTIQRGEKLKFFDYLTAEAVKKNITLMWWDNGQHFDRFNLSWRDKQLVNTVIHNTTGRISTAERDYIFIRKQDVVTDQRLRLNLHGNELVSLLYQSADGEASRLLNTLHDYSIEDDMLTITADFLLSLPSHPLGEAGQVRLIFNQGPEWPVRVIHYDTAVLKPSVNVGRTLNIPADFNGDELITMEAFVLKDGKPSGNAGPDGWTSYKQSHRCFTPDYSANRISINRDFSAELNDGDYLLRFHFLSGEKLEYIFTRDGATTTGKPVEPAPAPTPAPAPAPTVTPAPTAAPVEAAGGEETVYDDKPARRVPMGVKVGGTALAAVLAAGVFMVRYMRKRKRDKEV